MNAIGKGSHPSVGVKMLDRDHDHLSEILEEIQFRAAAGLAGGRTVEMVRRLAQTMQAHFTLEEGMMALTRYPGTAIHRLQHQLLVDQVNALATQHGRNARGLHAQLLNFFANSHYKHIGDADMDYGLWLSATGPHFTDGAGGAAPSDL